MEFNENQQQEILSQEPEIPTPEPIQFEVAQESALEPAQSPKRKKKRAFGRVVRTLVALLAVAAISCSITAGIYSSRLTAQSKRTEQTLVQLQEQIKDNSYTGNGNSVLTHISCTLLPEDRPAPSGRTGGREAWGCKRM